MNGFFSWAEMPGGNLLITLCVVSKEVCNIDTRREFVVTSKEDLQFKRGSHSSVYYDNYVYVIGGCVPCERYDCEEECWLPFGFLPGEHEAYGRLSLVVMESTQSIYVLGGNAKTGDFSYADQDLIWRLDLYSQDFEVLKVKLPVPCAGVPCYRLYPESTKIFMLLGTGLYSFDTKSSQIQLTRTVSRSYESTHFHCVAGAFYYSELGPALPISFETSESE
jgi:hypothetical protein